MALSEHDQEEFDRLVEARAKRIKALNEAKRKAEAASLEVRAFLAEHRLRRATTSDGHTAAIVDAIDWRNIDTELVEQDFPREAFPEVYVPSYQRLKEAANERVHAKDPRSTAAVSKYTGFMPMLRVSKNKKRSKR